jgi:DNA-binding IclR family transcriptional regulator
MPDTGVPRPRRRVAADAPRDDPQFAQTLERGLRVLQCFSANAPALGNSELAQMTGLPRPTVSRLTYTLIELGYLRRREDNGRFEVGTGVLCLGYPVLARLAFRRVAMPHLSHLAKAIDGIAAISVRDRLRMVTLENSMKRDIFRRRADTGFTLDFIGSTVGRGWLAGATASERDRLFREITRSAPGELDRVREDYQDLLRQLARDGFASLPGAVRPNTTALATPLRRRPGDELLVLSCAIDLPASRSAQVMQEAGGHMLAAAKLIAAELAGR